MSLLPAVKLPGVAAAVAVLWLAAPAAAWAQSFVSMGRLFTTPSERTQLDQARSSGAAFQPGTGGAAGAGGPGGAGGVAAPGGALPPMTGQGGVTASTGCATGAGAAGAIASGAGAPQDCAGGAEGAGAGLETVRLSGMIRRGSGHTTVFVNDEAQDGRAVNQGKAARVNIEGRTIILKPGQSYDPATGAINEADR